MLGKANLRPNERTSCVLSGWFAELQSHDSTGKTESERNPLHERKFILISVKTVSYFAENAVKMNCSACGHYNLEKTAKFCSECGQRISVQPANTQGE